jgi:putative oxidoreductase
MHLGQFALRATIGSLFIGHGTQKLFGWFGGHGLDATGAFFESKLDLRPGKRHALMAGAAEAGGGALLVLGAATPIAAAAVTGTMVTAIRKVHAPSGPWVTDNGWEYNAVLIAAVTALTATGPGRPSVDGDRFKGNALALAALAAGVAGSYLATDVLNDPAPETQEQPTDTAQTNGHRVPAGATA